MPERQVRVGQSIKRLFGIPRRRISDWNDFGDQLHLLQPFERSAHRCRVLTNTAGNTAPPVFAVRNSPDEGIVNTAFPDKGIEQVLGLVSQPARWVEQVIRNVLGKWTL